MNEQAASSFEEIVRRINEFNKVCEARERTDINEAWDLLHWIKGWCLAGAEPCTNCGGKGWLIR